MAETSQLAPFFSCSLFFVFFCRGPPGETNGQMDKLAPSALGEYRRKPSSFVSRHNKTVSTRRWRAERVYEDDGERNRKQRRGGGGGGESGGRFLNGPEG